MPREKPVSKAPLLCCVGPLFVALLAVLFVLPSCPHPGSSHCHQVKSVKAFGANTTTWTGEWMGEERMPSFSKLRQAHYTCHSGREPKKCWPKHGTS